MSNHRWSPMAIGLAGALAVTLCVPAGTALAQGVTAALSPAASTVPPGAEFDIELRITQAGSTFNGFDCRINYDPLALTFLPAAPTSLQQGTLFTDACGSFFHRFLYGAGADTINDVMLCAGTYVGGPGQLYKLHFRASSTVQVTNVQIASGSLKFYHGGLYVTPVTSTDAVVGIGTAPTAVAGDGKGGEFTLTASPNPGRGGTVLFASGLRSAGPESLTVRDVQGRVVHVAPMQAHRSTWDGRADSGELAANGVYFATLQANGRSTTIRLSWIH